ncbi:uncharacterized protein PHALS_15036 [Plasmopara halstedii]|uniref:Uncharacterized protein n=1 Tax=Plasmopara halstedii TaxID=4781 RepID=A0A0P1A788_PLAHL|nr:uncharacterized protein PHALS_15036 [Plasmopara halstedii]CEG36174.1 hypothetical protein PHALS_15036 [Plasmopara halstedii]|eukprot:XP_024572543.1 hypothetical protein PHALS_15036 [Plasmopara halstedii]
MIQKNFCRLHVRSNLNFYSTSMKTTLMSRSDQSLSSTSSLPGIFVAFLVKQPAIRKKYMQVN